MGDGGRRAGGVVTVYGEGSCAPKEPVPARSGPGRDGLPRSDRPLLGAAARGPVGDLATRSSARRSPQPEPHRGVGRLAPHTLNPSQCRIPPRTRVLCAAHLRQSLRCALLPFLGLVSFSRPRSHILTSRQLGFSEAPCPPVPAPRQRGSLMSSLTPAALR